MRPCKSIFKHIGGLNRSSSVKDKRQILSSVLYLECSLYIRGCTISSTVILTVDDAITVTGNSFNDTERCVCAGYDNGDIKLFDLRTMTLRWETTHRNGVSATIFNFHLPLTASCYIMIPVLRNITRLVNSNNIGGILEWSKCHNFQLPLAFDGFLLHHASCLT